MTQQQLQTTQQASRHISFAEAFKTEHIAQSHNLHTGSTSLLAHCRMYDKHRVWLILNTDRAQPARRPGFQRLKPPTAEAASMLGNNPGVWKGIAQDNRRPGRSHRNAVAKERMYMVNTGVRKEQHAQGKTENRTGRCEVLTPTHTQPRPLPEQFNAQLSVVCRILQSGLAQCKKSGPLQPGHWQ